MSAPYFKHILNFICSLIHSEKIAFFLLLREKFHLHTRNTFKFFVLYLAGYDMNFFRDLAVLCAVALYTAVGPGDLGEKMVLSGRLDVKILWLTPNFVNKRVRKHSLQKQKKKLFDSSALTERSFHLYAVDTSICH